MKIKSALLAASVAFSLGALPASGVVLAAWNFEPQPFIDAAGLNLTTGPSVTASSGIYGTTSIATGLHASAATDWTTPAGNGSTDSYSANTFTIGDYFQFSTASTDYTGITITFDQTGSGTGPKDFKVQYSTDGTLFTDLVGGSYAVLVNGGTPNASWNATTSNPAYSYSFNLSVITALDNDASIFFRLTDTSTVSTANGVVGTGGTSRIDNFVVSAIPEPDGAALFGVLGLFGILRRRR